MSAPSPLGRAELVDRLARTRSRGQIKALGADADADDALRAALVALAQERGVDDAADLSGKTLVRRLLAREDAARVRRNPIHRDEAFTCAWCGAAVPQGGRMVRDHCPRCLRSLHVDRVPGDRAADCGGVLQPVGLELAGGQVTIAHRCDCCGHEARVRAHPDDDVPPGLDPASLPPAGAHRAGGRARTLPRRVLEQIRSQRLWQPGDTVLVAVSGGLDSTVLLELLWRTRDAHGGVLSVLTVDHGLRPDSGQDVAHVLEHARRLAVPFRTVALDLARGPDLYARARAARRAALVGEGTHRIATAHHRDDQAETVLQRLASGSGGTGLAAMRSLDPPWCRPLLREPREVLRAWAEAEGLAWRDDPSNPSSQRGRLRGLLDGLEAELREGARAGLARSAALLARDDAFLEALVDRTDGLWQDDGLSVAVLSTLDPSLQARALRRLAPAAAAAPIGQVLMALEDAAQEDGQLPDGWAVDLGGARRLVVDGRVLRVG